MFCSKCGYELPNDAKVCSYCGTPTGNAAQKTTDTVSQKTKKNRVVGVVIGLVVFAICCAVIADNLKKTDGGDTSSVSGSSEISGLSSRVESAVSSSSIDSSGEAETVNSGTKTYVFDLENVMDSKIAFSYKNGIVTDIIGTMYLNLLTDADFNSTIQQTNAFKDLIEKQKYENMFIDIEESASTYDVEFRFNDLSTKKRQAITEFAASYIGLTTTNGEILMDNADEEMVSFGYALK